MEATMHNILIWLDSSKYVLLFLSMLVEGPVVMVTSGFLYSLGVFSFFPMYLVLVFGDFVADIVWYAFGRFGTQKVILKYGHYIGITQSRLEKVENYFVKYHQKILIISKLTMGLGFAIVVLIVAGMSKVPFKKYVTIVLIGGFIWTAMLIGVGYFLGNIFTLISGPMQIGFLIAIFLLIIFGLKYMNSYLKKQEF